MAVWDDILPEEDRLVFEKGGFGRPQGYGERPALLVVDVNYNFTGDKREPILDSIAKFRTACGEYGWAGIDHLVPLIDVCRNAEVPIVYTTMERRPNLWDDVVEGGISTRGEMLTDVAGSFGNQIVAEVAPRPEDLVIVKPKASAFFATPLVGYLLKRNVDSVIVAGTTTSGCVRAAVVDAGSYNLRAVVPEECVWDRAQLSHKVSLLDIHMKYGDVRSTSEVTDYVKNLAAR